MSVVPQEEIITGDRIVRLVDIVITNEIIAHFHQGLGKFAKKILLLPSRGRIDMFLFPDQTLDEHLEGVKIIYVYTQHLPVFFERIYPIIRRRFVLVSHNSDFNVGGHGVYDKNELMFRKALDEKRSRIIHWYSQNVGFWHKKLTPIPIGIANSMWPHGQLDVIGKIVKQEKTKLVYVNFSVDTNPYIRVPIARALARNGLEMVPEKVDWPTYLFHLSQHKFCICPPGNGKDTHRVWECLYLGVIPIVITDHMYDDFVGVLQVESWTDVTSAWLKGLDLDVLKLEGEALDMLKISYWRERIMGSYK